MSTVSRFDDAVDRAFDRLRGNPVADRVFYSASALGDWSLIWHLAGVAQGVTAATDGWQRALRLSVSLGAESALVNGVVKSFFRRARPDHEGERPHGLRMPVTSSFPSGHASSAFMAARLLSENTGAAGTSAWFALAAVVAASRIHVKIHHGSDVVGGALIGLALAEVVRHIAPLEGS